MQNFIVATENGLHIFGFYFTGPLLAAAAFACVIIFLLAAGFTKPADMQLSTAKLFLRALPQSFILLLITGLVVCTAWVGSLGAGRDYGLLAAAPFFNIFTALCALFVISAITHFPGWLALLWSFYSILQAWFLYLLISHSTWDLWIFPFVLTVLSAVFMWLPLALGYVFVKKGSLDSLNSWLRSIKK